MWVWLCDGEYLPVPPPSRMQSLLHRVRRPVPAGDAGAGGDAALPDGTLPARVRDVRLLLRAGGRRAASGPAGQVSGRHDDPPQLVQGSGHRGGG